MDDEPQDVSLKPFAELTEKELQALRLLTSGASREEIEAVTGLSLKEPLLVNPVTVQNALAKINARLSDSGIRDSSHTTSVVDDKDPTSEAPPSSE
jgi:hypothetical protein